MQIAIDQTTIIIALVVVAALIAGLIANRWVRPYAKTEARLGSQPRRVPQGDNLYEAAGFLKDPNAS